MNIYQKLIEVRKSIDTFTKDANGHNYTYISGTQVLGKIKKKMDDQGVILETNMTSQNHEQFPYVDKWGKNKIDFLVWGEMKMIWINADDPLDRSEIQWQMLGQQDDISKALGSGLTYAERYFLLKYFGIPTDADDPDAKNPKEDTSPKPPKPPNNSVPTKGNYIVNVPTKAEPPKADPPKPPVEKPKKPDPENPFLEKAEEIHEKAAWVISKLQKDKLNAIAKIKGVSLSVKGFEWTKKESSQFWLEADYLVVLAKLMKLEDKK